MIHGAGDRWFLPAVARLLRAVPAWPDTTSYSSVIAVEDLARLVAALAGDQAPGPVGRVYHATHPRPVRMTDLLEALTTLLTLPAPRRVPRAEHGARVARDVSWLTSHQYALLTEDHWYDSSAVWDRTGLVPGPGFAERFAAAAPWYRRHLTGPPPAPQ
ncbi:hypothetical protein N566_06605 [Streptomycetaceae bacterium MP113-05]|nr:hypothetical protein N566_06605 [Streptomycetaceae bacterium MP113-05]